MCFEFLSVYQRILFYSLSLSHYFYSLILYMLSLVRSLLLSLSIFFLFTPFFGFVQLPIAPTNFFWLLYISTFLFAKPLVLGRLQIGFILFLVLQTLLSFILSPFPLDIYHLFSFFLLISSTLYFFTGSSPLQIYTFLRHYLCIVSIFVWIYVANTLTHIFTGKYFFTTYITLRNSSLFTEPSHYFFTISPLILFFFLNIVSKNDTTFSTSNHSNIVQKYLITTSSLSLFTVLIGNSVIGYFVFALAFLIFALPRFLRVFNRLLRLKVSKTFITSSVISSFLILLPLLFTNIDVSSLRKLLAFFSYNALLSSTGHTAYALISNFYVALSSLTSNIFGYGLSTYEYVYNYFIDSYSLHHVFVSMDRGFNNSSNGGSLYLRLAVELGLAGVILLFGIFTSGIHKLCFVYSSTRLSSSIHKTCLVHSSSYALIIFLSSTVRTAHLQSLPLCISVALLLALPSAASLKKYLVPSEILYSRSN